ncbi:hypothetical protein V8J88_04635 [Massilia sp. W12]|uniref:hypothetical protein n=1 Tax=Massilia sp. W12 TaxID=3126507 RepID=UPI0030CEBB46
MRHPFEPVSQRRRFFLAAGAACLTPWPARAAQSSAPQVFHHPSAESSHDSRYQYDWEVLRMALERTEERYGPYAMEASEEKMTPARVTQEMLSTAEQSRLNVMVRATNPGLEQKLRPIRIPVDRGLLGFRIFLVRKANLPQFAAVRTLDDLRRLRAGQGRGWVDVQILQAAGLPVVEGSNYEGLFGMLQSQRFDYFSRAADEALREFQERSSHFPELAIEPSLLLHYPLPRYFFVRRDAQGGLLAERIESGLEAMLKEGSLQAVFLKHKADLIARAGLSQRRVLKIPNPTLSEQTPLARSALWFDPFSGKTRQG